MYDTDNNDSHQYHYTKYDYEYNYYRYNDGIEDDEYTDDDDCAGEYSSD